MTLLITILAAAICTAIWYTSEKARRMKVGVLCLMYWGAGLMWLVDAVVEYMEQKAEFFTPAFDDMINDAFLGLCAAALGLVIWLAVLLIKDPNRVLSSVLLKAKK